jgi:hypothetical protein
MVIRGEVERGVEIATDLCPIAIITAQVVT